MERLEGLLEGLGGKEEKSEKSKNLLALLSKQISPLWGFPVVLPEPTLWLTYYTIL